jgi:glycosyltransferase involved in cell wall biosynthesis
MRAASPLWVVNWSDSEDADFRAAWLEAGLTVRVLHGAPLGRTVGTPYHRFRSWPSFLVLAARGLAQVHGGPLIAWQPVAGALAALAPDRVRPRIIVLNPILDPGRRGKSQQLVLTGLKRATHTVFFSRRAVQAGVRMGLNPANVSYVPLGVNVRAEANTSRPGNYFLAIGREQRDWATLGVAARGTTTEIRVVGPRGLVLPPPLCSLPPMSRPELLSMLQHAKALVVPLLPAARTAGQLTVLDAMSVGRAVIATAGQGTEDYVTDRTGILVPPRDPAALADAMRRLLQPGVAEEMGRAALATAKTQLSLRRFVTAIDDLAGGRHALTSDPGSLGP